MDARRWSLLASRRTLWASSFVSESSMTGPLALLGILLLLVAIPLGLMIAPLVLGVILVVVAYRRFDRAVGAADPAFA
jgi:hypothetical protein